MKLFPALWKTALWGAAVALLFTLLVDHGSRLGFWGEFFLVIGTIISIPAVALHLNVYILNALLGAVLFAVIAAVLNGFGFRSPEK